jgi:hypothetical protein
MPLLDAMLEIKESALPDAGRGLFTMVDIARDTRITEYRGRIRTMFNAEKDDLRYAFIVKPGYAIDAIYYLKGIAQYANDATGTRQLKGVKNNCRYERDGLRVYIRSVLPIKAGDELLVFYGEEYWTEEGETTQESPVPKLAKNKSGGQKQTKASTKTNHMSTSKKAAVKKAAVKKAAPKKAALKKIVPTKKGKSGSKAG